MAVVMFNQLPDSARLWIYGFERTLTESESNQLTAKMNDFMQQWTAHKRELITAWELRYRQFMFIAVDERMMGASGCSIDSLVRYLGEMERRLGVNILNTHSLIFYRNQNQEIKCVDRWEFKKLAEDGSVNEDTIVFNNTLQTVGEIRLEKWEIPMKESWHNQVFGKAFQEA